MPANPFSPGTYTYKSIEPILPAVVIAAAQVADWITILGGVMTVIKFYLSRGPRTRVRLDVGVADKGEIRWANVEVDGDNADAEALVAEALRRVFPD